MERSGRDRHGTKWPSLFRRPVNDDGIIPRRPTQVSAHSLISAFGFTARLFYLLFSITHLISSPYSSNRGNLLKTTEGKLAFIDFGMIADIDEDDRYGLFGLVIGLQNKDLPLITENLLKVRYV